jgi:omega-6 fatty acid desaturase (delta-12 desaturase)
MRGTHIEKVIDARHGGSLKDWSVPLRMRQAPCKPNNDRHRTPATALDRRPQVKAMTEYRRLRRAIAGEAISRDTVAVGIMATDSILYVAALLGFCLTPGPLRWIELFVASIMAGALFLVGHDASHRALAASPWLNALIARLAFMPTLHPETAWNIGHNQRHHGATNLRGVDHVWTPWSPQEYRSATRVRRALYRFYRTPLGIGFYYSFELWWGHVWNSDHLDRSYAANARMTADKFIALAGFGLIYLGCFGVCAARGQAWTAAGFNALAAVIVPLVVYQYLMSITIFMHHTHPRIRWFPSRELYDPVAAQVLNTVHIRLPKPVELIFHEIFQHTAHHVNPRVPLYRLARAQRTLEAVHGPAIIQETFSIAYVLRLLRECQLYDYDAHRWLTIAEGLTIPDAKLRASA